MWGQKASQINSFGHNATSQPKSILETNKTLFASYSLHRGGKLTLLVRWGFDKPLLRIQGGHRK